MNKLLCYNKYKETLGSDILIKKAHLRNILIKSNSDFCRFIRQFSASQLLRKIYEISKEIYFERNVDVHQRELTYIDSITGNNISEKVIIQPWQFPDLAYQTIKNSNDYIGIKDVTDSMFLVSLIKIKEYIEFLSMSKINLLKSHFDYDLYIYGFGGEQFRYQEEVLVYHRMIRQLYIIFSISKKCNSPLNPEKIIEEEIGVCWKDLVMVQFAIFYNSLFEQSIDSTIDYITIESRNDKNYVFNKVINYFSIDYEEIRRNENGRQIFYLKPYIKTQREGLVSISVFFNLFIVEQSPYWIIRNHYAKKGSQKFIDEFGKWFEVYFDEMSNYYQIKKEKIVECLDERADWKIEIDEYLFLIEQKSSLVRLSVKQQDTDFVEFSKKTKNILYKALSQLYNTECDLKLSKTIKIVLCYEDYIDPNILSSIFSESDCPVKNDERYFIANIMELEMLFELSNTDKKLFKSVIEDMLHRNKGIKNSNVRLFKIMRDNGFHKNSYYDAIIFDEYKKIIEKAKNGFEEKRIIKNN